jgi:hypothetical protein
MKIYLPLDHSKIINFVNINAIHYIYNYKQYDDDITDEFAYFDATNDQLSAIKKRRLSFYTEESIRIRHDIHKFIKI